MPSEILQLPLHPFCVTKVGMDVVPKVDEEGLFGRIWNIGTAGNKIWLNELSYE